MKISPSKIKSYQMCPQLYDWTYNKKLISIKGKALTLGSRYHELVRQYHIDGKEHREKIGEEYELLWCYIKNPVLGNIIETEKRIEFEIPGLEHSFTIILDRIDDDKIIDYKTSSFDYSEQETINVQSILYVYYYWMTTGKILPFVFHVVNKKKAKQKRYLPQIMPPVIYTEEQLREVPEMIEKWVNKIETKQYKATPGPHCYGCDFGPMGLKYCTHYQDKLFNKNGNTE